MLHEGRVVFDVSGDRRSGLTVEGLVTMFRQQRGQSLEDDALLISQLRFTYKNHIVAQESRPITAARKLTKSEKYPLSYWFVAFRL